MRRRLGDRIYRIKTPGQGAARSPVPRRMYQQRQLENALRKVIGIDLVPVLIEKDGRMIPGFAGKTKNNK